MAVKKKIVLNAIKDSKLKDRLLKLFIERDKLMKQKEREQLEMHNKYLPKYLSTKILNAVGFIEYTKQKGQLNMPGMTKFLIEEKKFTDKEISWVLLLLSLEEVEEILSSPEISSLLKQTINKNRETLH